MKRGLIVVLMVLIAGCSNYPSNPPKDSLLPKQVFIEHIGTDYVPATPPFSGLEATKVNVVKFKITVYNFQPEALEFYGIAHMQGPPDGLEHVIYFRTDDLTYELNDIGYEFEKLGCIEPDSTYIFMRPKFPTNDYLPFDGEQGKIIDVNIIDVWAYMGSSKKISVELVDSPKE